MKLFFRILAGLLIFIFCAYIAVKIFVGSVNLPVGSIQADEEKLSSQIKVPEGFSFTVYADDVPNARELRLTQEGDLLVAQPNLNTVTLLKQDKNDDGRHDGQKLLLGKEMGVELNGPNGMDLFFDKISKQKKTWLYIAEQNSVGRIRFDSSKGIILGSYERLIKKLPSGGNHWKKSLRIRRENLGQDVFLYLSIGSSCNVCIEDDKRRATIMRYKLKDDGTLDNSWHDGRGEIYASGLRNAEGFDWSPTDGNLYATDNGRDLLGDDFPPCELNKVEQGKFYGWPFANGNQIPDPDYGKDKEIEISQSLAPVHEFRAHNAPLGMAFLRHQNQPESDYQGVALVVLHGSWNRSKKDGYKVVSLHWKKDGTRREGKEVIEERDFMSGFLSEDKALGRPAEIVEGMDGSIYISDDYAGAIYRVRYAPDLSAQ